MPSHKIRRDLNISICPCAIKRPLENALVLTALRFGVGTNGACGKFHQFVRLPKSFLYIRLSLRRDTKSSRVIGLCVSKSKIRRVKRPEKG